MKKDNIPFGSEKVREDLAKAGQTVAANANQQSKDKAAEEAAKLEARQKVRLDREAKQKKDAEEKEAARQKREAATAERNRVNELEKVNKKLGKLDKQMGTAIDKAVKAATHPELKPMQSMIMSSQVQMPRLDTKHYDCLEFVRPLVKQGMDTNDIITMVAKKFDFNRGLAKNYSIMAIERIECGVPPKSEMLKAAESARKVVEKEFAQKRKELEASKAELEKAA